MQKKRAWNITNKQETFENTGKIECVHSFVRESNPPPKRKSTSGLSKSFWSTEECRCCFINSNEVFAYISFFMKNPDTNLKIYVRHSLFASWKPLMHRRMDAHTFDGNMRLTVGQSHAHIEVELPMRTPEIKAFYTKAHTSLQRIELKTSFGEHRSSSKSFSFLIITEHLTSSCEPNLPPQKNIASPGD